VKKSGLIKIAGAVFNMTQIKKHHFYGSYCDLHINRKTDTNTFTLQEYNMEIKHCV
jgi:hypothetical protein